MTTLEQVLQLLQPAISSLVLALVLALLQALRKRTQDVRRRELLGTAEDLIATGVADAMQVAVASLKDPNKPGTWDEVSARDVKLTVIREAKAAAPKVFSELAKLGMAEIHGLLCRWVEQQVLAQKALAPLVYSPIAKPVSVVPTGGSEP